MLVRGLPADRSCRLRLGHSALNIRISVNIHSPFLAGGVYTSLLFCGNMSGDYFWKEKERCSHSLWSRWEPYFSPVVLRASVSENDRYMSRNSLKLSRCERCRTRIRVVGRALIHGSSTQSSLSIMKWRCTRSSLSAMSYDLWPMLGRVLHEHQVW